MKVTIEVDITDCTDCTFKRDHSGHGECWSYCGHPNNGRSAYDDILWGCQENFSSVPVWCPIGLQETEPK